MQLRRWFSRKYSQPPNSPLFDSETLTYWQAQLLLDYHAEAEQLTRDLSDQPPAGRSRAYVAWRQQAAQRLRALCATLQGTTAEVDRLLDEDQQAAARGELPAWLQRRLEARQSKAEARSGDG